MENPGLKIQPAIVQPMTKLIMPAIPASHLRRPRLNQRCQDMMKHKIILVTAPAGYGKTTFLSEALADMGHLPVAWISLDKRDDSLFRFWTNIILALQKIQSSLGQETLSILQNNEQSMELALTALINEIIEVVPELHIVLDDYHCIKSQTIHDSLNFLINYLPPQTHLIISSRTSSSLTLTRLRGQGSLRCIRLRRRPACI